MNYIKGKIKKVIFHNSESGWIVALFRMTETNMKELEEKINKTVTITGVFADVNIDITMRLYGDYIKNERFGMQFSVLRYEIEVPSTKEALVEFLSSSFIEGCGEKTAKKMVDHFKEDALEIIKKDKTRLLEVDGITNARAEKIYSSLMNYNKSSEVILSLQNLGFTIEECSKIYNHFKESIDDILGDRFYDMKEIIEFHKLDGIYIRNYGDKTTVRIYACILEAMQILSDSQGDTYYYDEEIIRTLKKEFNIEISEEALVECLNYLQENNEVVMVDARVYLKKYFDKEINIAKRLKKIDEKTPSVIANLDEKLKVLEKKLNIDYNEIQEKAVFSALNSNITIISGGPGTGKTTIINAIVKLYIEEKKLNQKEVIDTIALLAPTGRASKKMQTSTGMPAYTIHRYLKWYKDSNDFYYNEFNKTSHKLIIVDEVSMIDVDLFNALLNGITDNVKLILVGDIFQLPSVGPGLVLSDLIDSDLFNYIPLNQIYRQSENSYIPYLCKEIKNNDLSEEFLTKRDDYSFFQAPSNGIKNVIEQIINISISKKIDERRMQVLAPMYKGENGIDNLNVVLQNLYNPSSDEKEEMLYYDIIYREGDKVLQLVNDLENNVFNGDIGYISKIMGGKVIIDFEGQEVSYEKKDLKQIKHAYAITIHKSQGSEFDHVIMPITNSYFKMLYNKLVYTGVSRAKKSITIVGDARAFVGAVNNNYSTNRKTSLKERIMDVYTKMF